MNETLKELIHNTHDYSLSMDETMLRDRIRLMNELIKDENMRLKFDDMGKYCTVVDNHGGVTAQEAMDNMDNAVGGWSDLSIDNIPNDFRENNNYEVLFKAIDGSWNEDTEDRISILHRLIEGSRNFRYRIQEKKPIQITASIAQDLYQKHFTRGLDNRVPADYFEKLTNMYGREVIIID